MGCRVVIPSIKYIPGNVCHMLWPILSSFIMTTSSNGNISHVTGHLCGEFTGPRWIPRTQRPVTRSFDVFFDLRLNERLSEQARGWWFETLPRPLWRHSNAFSGFRFRGDVVSNWQAKLHVKMSVLRTLTNTLWIARANVFWILWWVEMNSLPPQVHWHTLRVTMDHRYWTPPLSTVCRGGTNNSMQFRARPLSGASPRRTRETDSLHAIPAVLFTRTGW